MWNPKYDTNELTYIKDSPRTENRLVVAKGVEKERSESLGLANIN